ncbi:MAG: hypothetical protein QW244_01175 [Candidatus Pacearchaeota archaeon]
MRFSKKLKKILNDHSFLMKILEEFDIELVSMKRKKEFKKYSARSIYGFIDYENNKIYIEKGLPKEEQEITILHELLHEYYDSKGLARNEYSIEKETMKIWWNKKYN